MQNGVRPLCGNTERSTSPSTVLCISTLDFSNSGLAFGASELDRSRHAWISAEPAKTREIRVGTPDWDRKSQKARWLSVSFSTPAREVVHPSTSAQQIMNRFLKGTSKTFPLASSLSRIHSKRAHGLTVAGRMPMSRAKASFRRPQ
jgi:hypothetical protein